MACEQEKQAFDAAQAALNQSVAGRAAAESQVATAQEALNTATADLATAEAAVSDTAADAQAAYAAYIDCLVAGNDTKTLVAVAKSVFQSQMKALRG